MKRVSLPLLTVWLATVAVASAAETPAPRILVMPFENVTHDGRIVWLGEAAAVLLADDLNAVGVNAITREERREAFQELQVPRSAALTDATVIRIGELVGASQVIVGALHMEDDTLVVRARAIALEPGRVQSDVTERGAIADLFAIFERLTRRIAAASSESVERAHPPILAFENYIKGLLAETPATAISYETAALKAEPTFDRARLALWDVYADQGDHLRALAAVTPVGPRSEAYRRARFLAGLSQLNLKRYEEAFATFKGLADTWPSPAVLNNLGIVQLRRGTVQQPGLATYYFTKAMEADTTEADYFFNLGYAYLVERDPSSAAYWLREALRRDPADGDAHYVLGVALTMAGSTTEAAREKELARRLSSTYVEWEKRQSADAPKGLERVKSGVELPHGTVVESLTANQRNQQELAQFYLDRARRLYRDERDREALSDANHALFLSPYEAEAHLLVGRIHLRGGRINDAIDALKISLWSAETAEAHAVLSAAFAENHDQEAARTEAQRALALDPQSNEARRVLDSLTPR